MNHLILSLDEAGTPQGWLTYKRGLAHYAKGNIRWHLGEEQVFHGGVAKATGQGTAIAIPSIIAIRNIHRGHFHGPRLTNQGLFRRDRNTCAYCGDVFHESHLTRDHIIPTSRDGENTWMNCVTACNGCNNRKRNYLLNEINMSLLYVPYVPSRLEGLILLNRNILADQGEFLRAQLPKHSRLLIH